MTEPAPPTVRRGPAPYCQFLSMSSPESWTRAVYRPSIFNLGFEHGDGAPMLGDWELGLVNVVCFGSQGLTAVPGPAG